MKHSFVANVSHNENIVGKFSGVLTGHNCFQSISEMKIMNLPLLSQLLGLGFSQFFHHIFVLNFTELKEEWRETSACPFMLQTPIGLPSISVFAVPS